MSKTEVEPVKGELVTPQTAMEELAAYVADLPPEDPEAVQERILRSILSARSPDELVAAGGAVSSADLLNIPLRAHSIHPGESTFADGDGWYLHVEVETIANGDRMVMSVGAQDVKVKLVTAAMRGWLPLDFKMERTTRPTEAGYFPVFMRSMGPAGNGARQPIRDDERVTTSGGGDPF